MGTSEIVIGSAQLVSSIVLGAMAVNYSKKVTIIERDRKEVEKRKEKVELVKIINELRIDLILFSSYVGTYSKNEETGHHILVKEFLNIVDNFKQLKNSHNELEEELLVKMAYDKVFTNSKYHLTDDGERNIELLEQDRELYKRCYFLMDILEIRNDTGNHSEYLKELVSLLDEGNSFYENSPLLFSVKSHFQSLEIASYLDKIKIYIKQS